MTSARTKSLGAAALGAAFLLVASAAYGCTVFRGQMTVSGNGQNSATQTVHGNGAGMEWCPNPGSWTVNVKGGTNAAGITITTASTTACGGSKLRDGTYTVTAHPGKMPPGGGLLEHNCHGQIGGTSLGTFSVSGGNGGGTQNYTYTAPTLLGSVHSVCVYGQSGNADANAVNLNTVTV